MVEAKAIWVDQHRFLAQAGSSHGVVVDGDSKTGSSPMELVLIGLCGCTGYDVASILTKKRDHSQAWRSARKGKSAPTPPSVYTKIKLVYSIRGAVSRKAAEDAIKLSEEKYCSVSAMLQKTAEISWDLELLGS